MNDDTHPNSPEIENNYNDEVLGIGTLEVEELNDLGGSNEPQDQRPF